MDLESSSGSKRRRNDDHNKSHQYDRQSFININDETMHIDQQNPQPMKKDGSKRVASGSRSKNSKSRVIDHFGSHFVRCVELQSEKVG